MGRNTPKDIPGGKFTFYYVYSIDENGKKNLLRKYNDIGNAIRAAQRLDSSVVDCEAGFYSVKGWEAEFRQEGVFKKPLRKESDGGLEACDSAVKSVTVEIGAPLQARAR